MREVKAYYDEKSEDYDAVFDTLYFRVYDAVTWKYLEPYVPTDSNAVVLDAGGGTGRWATRIARKGCKVVLLDSSEGMLRIAAKRVKKKKLENKITLKKADIVNTGYADETFDMIFCEHALFLFENPSTVIKELTRVLKKNAPIIISAQNRYVHSLSTLSGKPSTDNLNRSFKILVGKSYECMTENGEVKIYTWSPSEFEAMLKRNGLKVDKIIGKVITMPLRIRRETFMQKGYAEELFNKVLEFEFALCEKPDALALAGHLQAIARKKG